MYFNRLYECMYIAIWEYQFWQVLVYDNIPETELVWMKGKPGHVPQGAVVAGYRSNGDLLYVAKANNEAGHYDAGRYCAEYYGGDCGRCVASYWILTIEHSGYWTESQSIVTLVLLLHKYIRQDHDKSYGMKGYKNTLFGGKWVVLNQNAFEYQELFFKYNCICVNKGKITLKNMQNLQKVGRLTLRF